MNVLITKLGATGDVVRTTTLLQKFPDHVTWITEGKNAILLQNLGRDIRCLAWEERSEAADRSYDLVINLEDTIEVGLFIKDLRFNQLFGSLRRFRTEVKVYRGIASLVRFESRQRVRQGGC